MYREAEEYLNNWLYNKRRKPLILRGARQVGKTELVRQFAVSEKLILVEINLEKYLYLDKIFQTLSIDNIIKEIEAITKCNVNKLNTLLFLDEIQSTPHALQSLRYFYEEKPDLAVIAAGSLLEFTLKNHNFSMPVGRIEYYHLGPMTFKEFLQEIDTVGLNEINNYHSGDILAESAHRKLLERQREYLFVGGMPEAILIFSETNSLQEVSRVHRSIMDTYQDDFSKYAKAKDLILLQKVFNKIPKIIGNKIKYIHFSRDYRSKELKNTIDLLFKARICSPVFHTSCSGLPLNSDANENIFKLIFLDIGLVNYNCGIDWFTISSHDSISLINEGNLAEQFIGQHLLYRSKGLDNPNLHYWLRKGGKSNAEVDYVISQGNLIVPIEVKSGKKGTLKSLFQFVYHKKSKLGIRFDLNTPSLQYAEHILIIGNKKIKISFPLLSLPLYMVEEVHRIIDEIRISEKL